LLNLTRALFRSGRKSCLTGRNAVVLGLVTLLAVGTVAATPTPAQAATPEAAVALPLGIDTNGGLGAFGSNVVFGTHRSTDGGATWTTPSFLSGPTWKALAGVNLMGYQMTGSSYTATALAIDTGTTQTYTFTNSSWTWVSAMSRSWVLGATNAFGITTYSAYELDTGATVPVTAPTADISSSPTLTPSGGILWRGENASYQSVFAYSAEPGLPASPWSVIDNALASVVTETAFVYLANDAAGLHVCSRAFADLASASTCSTLMSGTYAAPFMTVFNFGASTVVHVVTREGPKGDYLWNGTTVTPIQLPPGASVTQPTSYASTGMYGDTPYLMVRDAAGIPTLRKVNSDGSLTSGTALPTGAPATANNLAVAPDRVVGSDGRDGAYEGKAWSRSVTGASFGDEALLPLRASAVAASAARTVVSGPDGLSFYDRGALTSASSDAHLAGLSGPYVLRWLFNGGGGFAQVSTVDGAVVASFPGYANGELSGSRFISFSTDSDPAGAIHLVVNDLTGKAAGRTVNLPPGTASCFVAGIAGDNSFIRCSTTFQAFSISTGLQTGSVSILSGGFYGGGDGYGIVSDYSTNPQTYMVWDLSTGSTTPLSGCLYPVASDGVGHIACSTDTQLVWRDFSSLSTAAPRLLGVLAAGTVDFTSTSAWTPQIDTTKALAAGTLVIRNSTGTTVRTLTTPASNDGSIRGVTWNGRNDSGAPVATGTYTYTLTATGKDGSGATTAIDGTAAASGTVTVTANVADTTAYEPFVKAAYQDFLNRQPTATELSTKSTALSNGTLTKNAFLTTMANSDEWLSTIVTKMYQDTLGRAPDAAGLTYWTGLIRNRTFSVAEVASRLYSSDEYYLYHAGATPTTWVTALYHALLSRAPDTAGLQQWVAYTNSPSFGRNRVAFEFYQSTESRLKRVDALYQALLGRGPDPTGWPYWAGQVYTTGDIVLATNLANSEEYWLRAKARYTT